MTVALSHPNVRIAVDEINPNNYGQFKKLYSKVYSNDINTEFSKVVFEHPEFSRYVFYNDIAVGAIVVDQTSTSDASDSKSKTSSNSYVIKQLLILPAYRRKGLASRLINYIIDLCSKDSGFTGLSIDLEQSSNDGFLLEWFNRLGFSKQGESYTINDVEILRTAVEKLKI